MARTGITAFLVGTAVAAVTIGAAVPAAASAPACSVRNGSAAFGSLQAAIAAAPAGSRLVIAGTCVGPFVIDKDLTLAGRDYGAHRPVLTGAHVSRVMIIEPVATVAISDVIIRDGNSTGPSGGGGLQNVGTVNLTRVLVTNNRTVGAGGGILNLGDMVLVRSLVSKNVSGSDGGGIYNAGDLTTWRTDLVANMAPGVGGGMFAEGIATMHGGRVTRNVAGDTGGGILTVNILTLDGTRVFGNSPNDCEC
ncbi:MAG TPA: hypothetical protein VI357_12000 [Mycobacteriales bacterium]